MWQRYVYQEATDGERRAKRTGASSPSSCFHVAFAVWAIAVGEWFLIVVVSLPQFYGARWYHTLVHATMHVGREPEADDFRKSCRSVKVDPFTSFMYWHMEWHTEHHNLPRGPLLPPEEVLRGDPGALGGAAGPAPGVEGDERPQRTAAGAHCRPGRVAEGTQRGTRQGALRLGRTRRASSQRQNPPFQPISGMRSTTSKVLVARKVRP